MVRHDPRPGAGGDAFDGKRGKRERARLHRAIARQRVDAQVDGDQVAGSRHEAERVHVGRLLAFGVRAVTAVMHGGEGRAQGPAAPERAASDGAALVVRAVQRATCGMHGHEAGACIVRGGPCVHQGERPVCPHGVCRHAAAVGQLVRRAHERAPRHEERRVRQRARRAFDRKPSRLRIEGERVDALASPFPPCTCRRTAAPHPRARPSAASAPRSRAGPRARPSAASAPRSRAGPHVRPAPRPPAGLLPASCLLLFPFLLVQDVEAPVQRQREDVGSTS